MQDVLQLLNSQIECIRKINGVTNQLLDQLNKWSQQQLQQLIEQEWEGLIEREQYYNQVIAIEEQLKKYPLYKNPMLEIQQKINQRTKLIDQLQEIDDHISTSFHLLKDKTMVELLDMKKKNKLTNQYEQIPSFNPAFIDERK